MQYVVVGIRKGMERERHTVEAEPFRPGTGSFPKAVREVQREVYRRCAYVVVYVDGVEVSRMMPGIL